MTVRKINRVITDAASLTSIICNGLSAVTYDFGKNVAGTVAGTVSFNVSTVKGAKRMVRQQQLLRKVPGSNLGIIRTSLCCIEDPAKTYLPLSQREPQHKWHSRVQRSFNPLHRDYPTNDPELSIQDTGGGAEDLDGDVDGWNQWRSRDCWIAQKKA